jgi:hypothetical protein
VEHGLDGEFDPFAVAHAGTFGEFEDFFVFAVADCAGFDSHCFRRLGD